MWFMCAFPIWNSRPTLSMVCLINAQNINLVGVRIHFRLKVSVSFHFRSSFRANNRKKALAFFEICVRVGHSYTCECRVLSLFLFACWRPESRSICNTSGNVHHHNLALWRVRLCVYVLTVGELIKIASVRVKVLLFSYFFARVVVVVSGCLLFLLATPVPLKLNLWVISFICVIVSFWRRFFFA